MFVSLQVPEEPANAERGEDDCKQTNTNHYGFEHSISGRSLLILHHSPDKEVINRS